MLALQRTFIGWLLVMSMRALWRELRSAMDLTADGVAGSLRFLSGVLDAIEEEDGYWHHLVAGVGITLQQWEEEHDGFGSLLRQEDRKRS
jgi:phage-related tail protein